MEIVQHVLKKFSKYFCGPQPLTEMSSRNISWGVNAAGAYG
jgi:hypothetical protein